MSNPKKQSFKELFADQIEIIGDSNIGIAHCRWATHGGNSDINAHPHFDQNGQFAIVHNGTIDNFSELRQFLLDKDIILKSETDSEVIVNLIAYYFNLESNSTDQLDNKTLIDRSIEQTIKQLKGIWSCVLLSQYSPDVLWGFHYYCPLIVGWNKNKTKISLSSERSGFDENIDFCAELTEKKIYCFNNSSSIDYYFSNTNKFESLDKNYNLNDDPYPYSHWMLREINEQKNCLSQLINRRIIDNHLFFPELKLENFVKSQHLIIIGCGTSYYAGKFSRNFFRSLDLYCTVQCLDASEFDLSYLPTRSNSVCILLSQSGETMDLIRVQQQLVANNIYNLAIVNVSKSTIQREADTSLLTEAGTEIAVASTKSYSCQIVMMKLISLWIEQELGNPIYQKLQPLYKIADQVEHIITRYEKKIKEWTEILADCEHLFILGKKTGYCLAKEASLKLKEVGYIHAESYSTSALKHGPYSLIQPGNPIMFILSKDDSNETVNNTIMEVKARGAITWVVTDNDEQLVCDDQITLPYNSELYGILHIIPYQLLSYFIALKKGHNPDYPRNLAKSVTVD